MEILSGKPKSIIVDDKVNNTVKGYSHELNQNQILNADYSVANYNEIAMEKPHHSTEERGKLLKVRQKHTVVFQGRKGKWKGPPVSFELMEGESN